jgi:hypothetical protein
MGLFDSKPAAGPLPLDVLTLEYLISGQVEPDKQKWAWTYFPPLEKQAAQALELTVTAARATGAHPSPALPGSTASFTYSSAMVALIPRGQAADALWDEWAPGGMGGSVAGELIVGPYAVTGTFLTADGTMSAVLNDRVAARDAVITRIDGAGDAAPIDAPRAMVATNLMQAALTGAAPIR